MNTTITKLGYENYDEYAVDLISMMKKIFRITKYELSHVNRKSTTADDKTVLLINYHVSHGGYIAVVETTVFPFNLFESYGKVYWRTEALDRYSMREFSAISPNDIINVLGEQSRGAESARILQT